MNDKQSKAGQGAGKNTGTARYRMLACLVCAAAALSVGCAGGPKYGAANISSSPAGAEIINLRDHTNLGKTPAQVVWQGNGSEQITIELQKRGYLSTIQKFWINKRHDTEEEARASAVDVFGELPQ
jgi:hypothetical protein